jgi:hypothetical protein
MGSEWLILHRYKDQWWINGVRVVDLRFWINGVRINGVRVVDLRFLGN